MKRKRKKQAISKNANQQSPDISLIDLQRQQNRMEWLFLGLLLAAGIYLSVVYYGQKAVPNSDFSAFVRTGEQILHFQMPSSFKRVPVLGMLQVAMGKLMVTSPHPVLTGALVLNGILYTFSIMLLYKVARFFLEPTASFCLGLVAAINPWAISMLVDPIAETAIVFFLVLTFYLMFKRSRWCYLAAMVASMTRYECFGLIIIALLFDLFGQKSKRQKLTALGMAFVASVPMIVWLIGTKMTKVGAGGHYFRVFLNVENRNGMSFLKMLWHTTFSALLQWPEWIRAILIERPATKEAAEAIQSHKAHFQMFWNSIAAVFFVSGLVWGFIKKQWKLVGVLLFWSGYACIHMSQSVLLDRYTVPIIWLTLLVSAYGLASSGQWLARRLPRTVMYIGAALLAVIAFIWAVRLWPAVSRTADISAASAKVAYVVLFLALVFVIIKQFLLRRRTLVLDIGLFTIMALMIVSNQFSLSLLLGQGKLDIEFRKTAEWYFENAEKTDKLATTLPGVVNLFLPQGRKNAVHTNAIPGENIAEFAKSCKKRQIRYIAWDSRLGFAVRDVYYKMWGLKKVHPLGAGKDIGPFKFITTIKASDRRYIHLYRLHVEKSGNP